MLRIVFMTSCPGPCLEVINDQLTLVGVATDNLTDYTGLSGLLRKAWNGLMGEPSLQHWATRRGIPLHRYHREREEAFADWLRQLEVDLLVTCKAPLLPASVFSVPRHGAINIHYSLLPHYRGGSPLLWQVVNGETRGGVTIHYIDTGIDTGPILCQAPLRLPQGASAVELERLLDELAAKALVDALAAVAAGERGTTPFRPTEDMVFARNIKQASLVDFIDWDGWPLERIWRVLRFMEFWPADHGIPPGWSQLLRWRVGYIVSRDTVLTTGGWRIDISGGYRLLLRTRRGTIELMPSIHLPTLLRHGLRSSRINLRCWSHGSSVLLGSVEGLLG